MSTEIGRGLLGEYVAEGFLLVTLADDPAAGNQLDVPVPGRARWQLVSLAVVYTDGEAVGSRVPVLTFDDGSTVYMRSPMQGAIAAGAGAIGLCWFVGATAVAPPAALSHQAAPIPPTVLLPGHHIRTVTPGMTVASDYSQAALLVQEVPERGPVAELTRELVALRERLGEIERAGVPWPV